MHEMGIAVSVVEALEKELAFRPGARLLRVALRVGEMAGLDSESLSFCFTCITKDTPFETAELSIERSNDDALDLVHLELEVP